MIGWQAPRVPFGITGHRDVEQEPGELDQFARLSVARMVAAGATEIITGMARGWDLSVALACCELAVPFVALIPFEGQHNRWDEAERSLYLSLRCEARQTFIYGGSPATRHYLARDRDIVNWGHQLWALDSGRRSGSHTTVLYAESIGRKVVPLWGDWIRFRGAS